MPWASMFLLRQNFFFPSPGRLWAGHPGGTVALESYKERLLSWIAFDTEERQLSWRALRQQEKFTYFEENRIFGWRTLTQRDTEFVDN